MKKENKELEEKLIEIYQFIDGLKEAENKVTDDDTENIAILEVVNDG